MFQVNLIKNIEVIRQNVFNHIKVIVMVGADALAVVRPTGVYLLESLSLLYLFFTS